VGLEQRAPARLVAQGQTAGGGDGVGAQHGDGAEQPDGQAGRHELFERRRCTGQADPDQLGPRDEDGQGHPQAEDIRSTDNRGDGDDRQGEPRGAGCGGAERRAAQPTRAIPDDIGGGRGQCLRRQSGERAPGGRRGVAQGHEQQVATQQGRHHPNADPGRLWRGVGEHRGRDQRDDQTAQGDAGIASGDRHQGSGDGHE
jgi:hypothetical protein